MSWHENLNNLKNTGALKEITGDPATIKQYLQNGSDYLRDAIASEAPISKFTLAYEGIHSVCLGVLNHVGVRPAGEGHRNLALQLSTLILGMDDIQKGMTRTISTLHHIRNDKTYERPSPPMTQNNADLTVSVLQKYIDRAYEFTKYPKPDTPNTTSDNKPKKV